MADGQRFEPFTDEEKATMSLSLVLLALDSVYGMVTGEPAPAKRQGEILLMVASLVDEMGLSIEGVDRRIDPGLLASLRMLVEAGGVATAPGTVHH
jgi:hypothetical protein